MKVSCVIPAYNEEKRIGAVLDVLAGDPDLDEVIVVDDASKDKTSEVVRRYNVKLIHRGINKGKSHAVKEGIEAAKNEHIILIDADLRGLTRKNIHDLIEPVKKGVADVSFSRRITFPWVPYLFKHDFLTGERVFDRKILDLKNLDRIPGFGLETYMNERILQLGLRVRIVPWNNVHNTLKMEKNGFFSGNFNEIRMWYHISRTYGHGKFWAQWRKLKTRLV